MKAKKYTLSSTILNEQSYIDTDLSYTDAIGNTSYPTAIRYSNLSDATLGFISISNDTEKLEVATNPSYYDYLEIISGDSSANLPPTKYLRISKLSGIATGSLTFYVFNYISWKND
jgi:hypothetical protein